jgi:hypothetical protein
MRPLLVVLLLVSADPRPSSGNGFDSDKAGGVPSGWRCGVTGEGTSRWSIRVEPSAPSAPQVLEQTGSADFSWCVMNEVAVANGTVEVKLKPISGQEDQAGGLVWRWKDAGTYYLARANALEDNVTLYAVTAGRRRSFKSTDIEVATGQWHRLSVDFNGRRFIITFNGKKVIEGEDDTIQGEGQVGVWTKADSVTAFDDFQVRRK